MNRFLCPGFSLLHQADTENQQTQDLAGAQLQPLLKERHGAAQPSGPPLLSGDVLPRRSSDKAMQDNVACCGKMHHAECVSIPGDLLPAPSPQGIIL